MNIIDCGGQGTQTWFDNRLGRLTASRISDAISKAKRETTGELQKRRDFKLELAVERVTGRTSEHFVSEWMERGIAFEDLARAAYELKTDTFTDRADLVIHPSIEWAACSPDGLVGDDGLCEIKVPKPTTHAEYLLAECVPERYLDQMMFQLACTGRDWNDFISWCPDFPEPLDLFICRLHRDPKRISEMENDARKFLEEVDALVLRLKSGMEGVLRMSLVPRAVIPQSSGANPRAKGFPLTIQEASAPEKV